MPGSMLSASLRETLPYLSILRLLALKISESIESNGKKMTLVQSWESMIQFVHIQLDNINTLYHHNTARMEPHHQT